MNGNPTAAQKRFHCWCRESGCMLINGSQASIHHIKGAKMKLKGCKKAGEWYVIPISYACHQGRADSIHQNRKAFERCWNVTEKQLWKNLIDRYVDEHGKKPMNYKEYQIILERA